MTPTLVADFFVPGKPETAGSKKGFYSKKHNRVFLVDDNPKGKSWMALVASFAQQAAPPELLDGPLAIEVEFRLARPRGHYNSKGQLLPSAPAWPATIPDRTKLLRCLEDGLTGVLWRNDSRIVTGLERKVYAEDGRTGAHVRVWALANEAGARVEREASEVLVAGRLF